MQMMSKKSIRIILLLLGLIIVLVVIANYLSKAFEFGGLQQKEVIVNNHGKQYVFIAKTWGLAGNHEQIELITPAGDTCVFYTDELVYQNTAEGLVVIPWHYNDEMNAFSAKDSTLTIKAINNLDSVRDLYGNYKQLGYEKIDLRQLLFKD